MIELPESHALAKQLTNELTGRKIKRVLVGKSPHKFAFFHEGGEGYEGLLRDKVVSGTKAYGGHVEIEIDDCRMDFSDGVNLRLIAPGEAEPNKHQLYVGFEDGSALVGSVQMYGALMAFRAGTYDNPYYLVAHEKISPLEDAFDQEYFMRIADRVDRNKVSIKAFLATDQRIPGLGNGVLQDILWNARIHPKRKLADLSDAEFAALYRALKDVLRDMSEQGGRDTEKDIYGKPGGYYTVMSKNNVTMTCPACGGRIKKEAYLGGNIYYCPNCQRI